MVTCLNIIVNNITVQNNLAVKYDFSKIRIVYHIFKYLCLIVAKVVSIPPVISGSLGLPKMGGRCSVSPVYSTF